MAWSTGTGIVERMAYVGPAAPAPWWHWTAIMVTLESGERITALLEPSEAKANRLAPGDRIRLEYQPGAAAGMTWWGGKRGRCRIVEVQPRLHPMP